MGSGMARSLKYPALALAFAFVLVCYSVWDLLGQLSGRRYKPRGRAISRRRPSWRHRADGSVPYRHGRDHGVHAANHELTRWVRPTRSRSRIRLCKGGGAARAAVAYCRCGQPCRIPSASDPVAVPPERKRARIRGLLVLQVGVGSAVSASLARQIENAVDYPDRVEGAGVAALERHLARPVMVDPVLVA